MLSLDEDIRVFVDSGIRPVSADEAMGADCVRAGGPGEETSRVSRRRLPWLAAATGLVLATVVVLLITLLLPTVAPRGRRSSEVIALETAARNAASSSLSVPAGQYLTARELFQVDGVFYEASGASFDYELPGTDVWYVDGSGTGQEELQLGKAIFPSSADRTAYQAAGSPRLGASTQLTEALPLSPSQSQSKENQHGLGAAPAQPTLIPYDQVQALSLDPKTLERQLINEFEGGYSDPAQTLGLAGTILEEGASSAQRRALYEMITTLPGVTDDGSVMSDVTDQPGVGVSITENGYRTELIFDPNTSAVLEERRTPLSPSSEVPATSGPTSVNEQWLSYVVFASVRAVPSPPTS